MNHKRDVIVFLEPSGNGEEAANSGLLSEAARIAGWMGGEVFEIVAGPFEHPCGSMARQVKAVLKDIDFGLLLFAHTDLGRVLAPLVAFEFGTAAVTDCRDVRFSGGVLHFVRNVYGDQFEREMTFRCSPGFASLNPESLKAREGASPVSCPARKIRLRLPERKPDKKRIERMPPDFRTVDLRYAKRVLDIGFGCARPELLEMARELAHLLEASVGTTRPMVDDGYWPKERMIGQTGKSTAPEFCITLGVSGSPHHAAGFRKSGTVLSVNSDGRAPIFEISDKGFVSDLNGVLPRLIRRIREYRDKGLR